MKKYHITVLKKSFQDLDDITVYISKTYKAPLIAKRYTEGILSTIRSLSIYAESIPISTRNAILEKYGDKARRINYKKHAIIYTVKGSTVVVRRIIVGSLIK